MASNDSGKIMWGAATVYYGTVGQSPATQVGYTTDDGVHVKMTTKREEYRVEQRALPLLSKVTEENVTISFALAQASAESMGLALGKTPASTNIVMGGDAPSASVNKAWKILGTDEDGNAVSVTILEGAANGDVEWAFQKKAPAGTAVNITALDADSGSPVIIQCGANITATLSTGTFVRTLGTKYYRVAGEGGAADALTDITAADLADTERITLQISAATMPITLTHASGVVELTGACNWVMTNMADWIKLQYNLSGTKWVEISRFDAIA